MGEAVWNKFTSNLKMKKKKNNFSILSAQKLPDKLDALTFIFKLVNMLKVAEVIEKSRPGLCFIKHKDVFM